ncbi:MAG: ATP-grasp domain-containing protein [Gammaproteobacteria bacterium]|nr:ATP-grasp domain-containing protein [Gammaproteobacteria bacterium]
MKRALVLDAGQRGALAVTRSLGAQGVSLVTADESRTALAGCSRFSQRFVTYPSPRSQPERFVSDLAELCRNEKIDIAFPMTELTTALLLAHRSDFPDITLPFPAIDTVEALANKCSLMRLAETLGVPIPRTWYADNPAELPANLADLPYPLVLKPGKSWLNRNGQWLHTSVKFAATPSEAATILESDPAFHAHPFLLQECVAGYGQGVFALYDKGKPLAFFAHRRLREKPPRGGVSVLSESIPVDPALLAHARALLDKAGWHGIAMVEFKVSAEGAPYLMEINTRFWGSLQLAVDAGIDFPWLLYRMACGERVEPVEDYKVGARLRWLLGDLDRLYLITRDSEYAFAEKLKALLGFVRPDPIRTRHEVDRWGDPGPAWWELKQYLRDILGRG